MAEFSKHLSVELPPLFEKGLFVIPTRERVRIVNEATRRAVTQEKIFMQQLRRAQGETPNSEKYAREKTKKFGSSEPLQAGSSRIEKGTESGDIFDSGVVSKTSKVNKFVKYSASVIRQSSKYLKNGAVNVLSILRNGRINVATKGRTAHGIITRKNGGQIFLDRKQTLRLMKSGKRKSVDFQPYNNLADSNENFFRNPNGSAWDMMSLRGDLPSIQNFMSQEMHSAFLKHFDSALEKKLFDDSMTVWTKGMTAKDASNARRNARARARTEKRRAEKAIKMLTREAQKQTAKSVKKLQKELDKSHNSLLRAANRAMKKNMRIL